jgi:hypothetical protein
MIRSLGLAVAVLTVALIPLGAEGSSLSGNWEAHVMGSKVVVHVDQKGHALTGEAYVYGPLGRKSTYHFRGLIKGRQVQASHYTGHRFTGSIQEDGTLVGVLRTRSGHRIPVHARLR